MSKRQATTELSPDEIKKHNSSTDYVFYNSAKKTGKVYQISPTKIGKGPIYKSFIDVNGNYFRIKCMPD